MPRKPTGKHTFSEIERIQKNGEIYVYERESLYDLETRSTNRGTRPKESGQRMEGQGKQGKQRRDKGCTQPVLAGLEKFLVIAMPRRYTR